MSNDTFVDAWNLKPDYPWVYGIQPGNAVFAALGVLLFGLLPIVFFRETKVVWLVLSALASLIEAYVFWYAKTGKLIVTEDHLEIRRPLWSRKTMRSAIIGRRGSQENSSGYVWLRTTSGSSLIVRRHGWFKLDRHFLDWLNSLPVL